LRALAMLLALLPARALAADPPGKTEFEEAKRLFDSGRPNEALPLFEKAYQLSGKRASTALALALCEREVGRHEQALAHLQEYLEKVPADRSKYESVRAELEQKVSSIEVKPPPPPPPPPKIETPPPPPPKIVAPPPIEEPSEGPSALKITLLSAGGAVAVVGVVFAVLAATAESDVNNRVEDGRGPVEEIESRADRGFRFAVTADVLVPLGLAAAGVGLFVD
jgi:tetratricopeptide (TPR) repeat protein